MSKLSLKTAKQERNEVDRCGLSSPCFSTSSLERHSNASGSPIGWRSCGLKLLSNFAGLFQSWMGFDIISFFRIAYPLRAGGVKWILLYKMKHKDVLWAAGMKRPLRLHCHRNSWCVGLVTVFVHVCTRTNSRLKCTRVATAMWRGGRWERRLSEIRVAHSTNTEVAFTPGATGSALRCPRKPYP